MTKYSATIKYVTKNGNIKTRHYCLKVSDDLTTEQQEKEITKQAKRKVNHNDYKSFVEITMERVMHISA